MMNYRMIASDGKERKMKMTNSPLDAQKYYLQQAFLKREENYKDLWANVKKAKSLKISLPELCQNQFDLIGESEDSIFNGFEFTLNAKESENSIIEKIKETLLLVTPSKIIIHLTLTTLDASLEQTIRDFIKLDDKDSPIAVLTIDKVKGKRSMQKLLIITIMDHNR